MTTPDTDALRQAALRIMKLNGLTFADCVTVFTEAQSERELKYVAAAREMYHVDGETEIDDKAIVSGSRDAGDYVMAWVWVPDVEAGLGEDG